MIDKTIDELRIVCKEQRQIFSSKRIKQFKTQDRGNDSSACTEIVRRALAKDEVALAELMQIIKEHCERKYQLLAVEDREDLIQEVCIKLHKRWTEKNHANSFASFAEFLSYIYTTVNNLQKNQYRSQARRGITKTSSLDADFETETRPQIEYEFGVHDIPDKRNYLIELLRNCLQKEIEYDVMYLRYMLDDAPEDILAFCQKKYPELNLNKVYDIYRVLDIAKRNFLPCAREMGENLF